MNGHENLSRVLYIQKHLRLILAVGPTKLGSLTIAGRKQRVADANGLLVDGTRFAKEEQANGEPLSGFNDVKR